MWHIISQRRQAQSQRGRKQTFSFPLTSTPLTCRSSGRLGAVACCNGFVILLSLSDSPRPNKDSTNFCISGRLGLCSACQASPRRPHRVPPPARPPSAALHLTPAGANRRKREVHCSCADGSRRIRSMNHASATKELRISNGRTQVLESHPKNSSEVPKGCRNARGHQSSCSQRQEHVTFVSRKGRQHQDEVSTRLYKL